VLLCFGTELIDCGGEVVCRGDSEGNSDEEAQDLSSGRLRLRRDCPTRQSRLRRDCPTRQSRLRRDWPSRQKRLRRALLSSFPLVTHVEFV
jgi:hypothetical protein